MSEFRYTVAMPPGATGGKWILTPQAQHPVGDVVVALPHTGEITATGVLVSDGAAPDLPASVPGEDVASPEYLLELSYTRAGRQVPGVPVRLRMVETEPGIVDVAQLLREGRALAVTPEQLVSLRTAEEAALEAAQSVTAATLDLSGERERVQQALDDIAQTRDDVLAQQQTNNTAQQTNNVQTAAALSAAAQAQAEMEAQRDALTLPPWTVTQNVPEYVEIAALLPGAWNDTTATLPHTGITIPTLEVIV